MHRTGQILDIDPDADEAGEGANVDLDAQRKGKCAVIKTSTRQTIFLPLVGLVDPATLRPKDLIGVNKDSYLVLDTLPAEYDSRVKAMEVDEKPTESYNDIGGLDKQIEELVEAIVMPMQQAERFKALGIKAPKGCLMYGPPGASPCPLLLLGPSPRHLLTPRTPCRNGQDAARPCVCRPDRRLLPQARCALSRPGAHPLLPRAHLRSSLVLTLDAHAPQMFIGDGAKLVRDAFELAKQHPAAIIFIDELDAIGTKRFDSDKSGDREVQRTMLELLNQLDGFGSDDRIKVIAATNRIDVLDPALLRSGRLDRKIEFPLPNEDARAKIMECVPSSLSLSLARRVSH